MTIITKTQRDEVQAICENNPGTWFDLSYKVKYKSDGSYDFTHVIMEKSVKKAGMSDEDIDKICAIVYTKSWARKPWESDLHPKYRDGMREVIRDAIKGIK